MTPTVSTHAVFRKSDGALQFLAPASYAATDEAFGTVALPAGFNEEWWVWNPTTRVFAESAAKVQAVLLSDIKQEAERRKMAVMSPGGAKKSEYAEKRAEVANYDRLSGVLGSVLAAVNALTESQKQSMFGHAMADAAAFGDNIPAAIARFRVGMSSASAFPRIAATEAKVCAAIKAATTVAAKRAAASSVVWPT